MPVEMGCCFCIVVQSIDLNSQGNKSRAVKNTKYQRPLSAFICRPLQRRVAAKQLTKPTPKVPKGGNKYCSGVSNCPVPNKSQGKPLKKVARANSPKTHKALNKRPEYRGLEVKDRREKILAVTAGNRER